ncbi:MAG TPA: GGDEF domain-containing protein [Pseudomonadales bacterium]|nr:GGDEF domain-containing protein [Pseudomonadales bacterium]
MARPSDLVSRYGGEEFAVLLPSTALTGALQIAERIREQVKAEAVVWQEQPIWLTVSIGVASLKIDSSITPDLIVR